MDCMEIDATDQVENTTQLQPYPTSSSTAMANSISDAPVATNEAKLVPTPAIGQLLPGESSSTNYSLTIEKRVSWEDLPYEMREKVFEGVTEHEWTMELPYHDWPGLALMLLLMEALRWLLKSYAHAVEFFNRYAH